MQEKQSVEKNASFFSENIAAYNQSVQELDTYRNIREFLGRELGGTGELLDIGNGGVFDYDTSLPKSIVGLDLFLDQLPSTYVCPKNVTLKQGSALDIPFADGTFDSVLMVMLIHHLVGKNVAESIKNMDRCISEAARVLKPGGKMLIIESCVPRWFYLFERLGFPIYSRAINAVLSHPATLQYTSRFLTEVMEKNKFRAVRAMLIPKGRWLVMLGFKVPGFITPVQPYLFIGVKAPVRESVANA